MLLRVYHESLRNERPPSRLSPAITGLGSFLRPGPASEGDRHRHGRGYAHRVRRSFAGSLAALLPILALLSCDAGSQGERSDAWPAEADLIEELNAIGYVAGAEPAGTRSGVSLHDAERVQPGLNLFTSGHGPVAVLMDMDGVVLNEWRVGFDELFPDHPHAQPGAEPRRRFWRVARLLAGGDLIAIWELYGIFKLDRDSRIVWVAPGTAHHDLHVTPDGRIHHLEAERR